MDQDIKRKQAAAFIDEVLQFICQMEEGRVTVRGGYTIAQDTARNQMRMELANRLRTIASNHGLEVPRPCTGEAHSNPHIDNCGVCLNYHWGLSGKNVKVR
jgi:hypothetical protein